MDFFKPNGWWREFYSEGNVNVSLLNIEAIFHTVTLHWGGGGGEGEYPLGE